MSLLHIRIFLIVINERTAQDVWNMVGHIKKDNGTARFEYLISYDESITSDHVTANAVYPR